MYLNTWVFEWVVLLWEVMLDLKWLAMFQYENTISRLAIVSNFIQKNNTNKHNKNLHFQSGELLLVDLEMTMVSM